MLKDHCIDKTMQKITCECKCQITLGNKSRHLKSLKHKDLIQLEHWKENEDCDEPIPEENLLTVERLGKYWTAEHNHDFAEFELTNAKYYPRDMITMKVFLDERYRNAKWTAYVERNGEKIK
jgi:hypothetical protein